MKSEASASVMISIAMAAPPGPPISGMRSSRVSPNMSIVIWHGMNSTPRAMAASRSSRGLATPYCLRSVPIIHGPMPRKFILLSFRWSIPGRCMSVSIRCIQFSPTIRFWSRTKGSRPQKVTKTRQRTPLAAAVDDRMRTGKTLSRSPDQLTITSSFVFVSASGGAGTGAGSGTPSTSAIASASGSIRRGSVRGRSMVTVVIAIASLPAHDEAEHAAVDALFDELVAGRPGPCREVLDRSRIGREDLEQRTGWQALDRLGGLHDRHRARQPAGIDPLEDLEVHRATPSSDEHDGAVAGLEMERRDSLDAVDERVEVGRPEMEQVHRQRAGLDVDAAEVLGLTERLRPAGLPGGTQRVDRGAPGRAGLGRQPVIGVDPVRPERVERPVLEEHVDRPTQGGGTGGQHRGGLQP